MLGAAVIERSYEFQIDVQGGILYGRASLYAEAMTQGPVILIFGNWHLIVGPVHASPFILKASVYRKAHWWGWQRRQGHHLTIGEGLCSCLSHGSLSKVFYTNCLNYTEANIHKASSAMQISSELGVWVGTNSFCPVRASVVWPCSARQLKRP